jgi:para-aminobenzoate synthetase component 1
MDRNQTFIWLDSQLAGHPSSQQSILFKDFRAILTFEKGLGKIQDAEGNVIDHVNTNDPWSLIAEFRSKYPGYIVGFLGYDLKNYTESLNSDNPDATKLPEIWLGAPEMVFVQDVSPTADKKDSIEIQPSLKPNIRLKNINSADRYIHAVEKAQRAIYEGDIYEVNLSHQLNADFFGNPLDLFEYMYQRGPVPYAAYLQTTDFQVCCASPERFLMKSGQRLISDPIKGTRARGMDPETDSKIVEELISSEKDRAENLMIVDLVRHDMSQFAVPGTVNVTQLFDIQTFGTVHQMVSRVESQLKPDVRPEHAIAACFPMGSMTGAPKIRAMEYIESLENYKRGLYSGAIGFFDPGGDFNFNVVIRSAIVRGEELWYSAGGAITSDSIPQQEWEETLIKVRALGIELNP